MAKNPFIPSKAQSSHMQTPERQSMGILDDYKTGKVDITKELYCQSFQMPTGAGAAKVLTSDASGNGTWQAGGGGSAHIIKDEGGADLAARRNLNFTGAGVVATDNAGTDSTDVTIAGGGVTAHDALSHLAYADAGHTGFAPALGLDDNYVTDAEKIVIGNTSGTNTGDASGHAGLQPIDATLTALAGLDATAGFVKQTGPDAFTKDTNTYLTAEADTLQTVMTRGATTATQLISTLAVGTKPFDVTSTTACTNLNADYLDGNHAAAFATSAQGTLADNAIPKGVLTEQGDVIYASAASTPAALAHGTAGQVLQSGGHAANPSWLTLTTPKVELINDSNFANQATYDVQNIAGYRWLLLCWNLYGTTGTTRTLKLTFNADTGAHYRYNTQNNATMAVVTGAASIQLSDTFKSTTGNGGHILIPVDETDATGQQWHMGGQCSSKASAVTNWGGQGTWYPGADTDITRVTITCNAAEMSGNCTLYGIKV